MSDLLKTYQAGILMGIGLGLVLSSVTGRTTTLLGLFVPMVGFGLIMMWFGRKRSTDRGSSARTRGNR